MNQSHGIENPADYSILLTNDDGYEAPEMRQLAARLLQRGYQVTVVAPLVNQSACAQKLTMNTPLSLVRQQDILAETTENGKNGALNRAMVFSLSGTPSDCVVAALEPRSGVLHQNGISASLVISGINQGPNLGSDVMYSGTFAAARQAGVYGFPSLASSIATYDKILPECIEKAIDATVFVAERLLRNLPTALPNRFRDLTDPLQHHDPEYVPADESEALHLLRDALAHGDLLVNLNVAKEWKGAFATCRLGAVFYRDVLRVPAAGADSRGQEGSVPVGTKAEIAIGGGIIMQVRDVPNSDIDAIEANKASISTLNCWPETHPLQVSPLIMQYALRSTEEGLPTWLCPGDAKILAGTRSPMDE
ncbi:5'-nucleotidase SurE [Porphyridium purpureum]|uniref:5'-nucleotidase SurE n=1 Tax=Porphyridium purpureum TaxID=35688 RepID=A0A5J4YZ61_PORPP|nr:5'-nucleotidase SurE [Porphyridium purpureum]|eukprot:POR5206..scf208_2